jgi:hypothetical protein
VQLARSLAVTPLSLMSKGAKNISPISSDCWAILVVGWSGHVWEQHLFCIFFMLKHKMWCGSKHAFPIVTGKFSSSCTGGNGWAILWGRPSEVYDVPIMAHRPLIFSSVY